MKKTLIDLFESSVEKYGDKTFLLEKDITDSNPRPMPKPGSRLSKVGEDWSHRASARATR